MFQKLPDNWDRSRQGLFASFTSGMDKEANVPNPPPQVKAAPTQPKDEKVDLSPVKNRAAAGGVLGAAAGGYAGHRLAARAARKQGTIGKAARNFARHGALGGALLGGGALAAAGAYRGLKRVAQKEQEKQEKQASGLISKTNVKRLKGAAIGGGIGLAFGGSRELRRHMRRADGRSRYELETQRNLDNHIADLKHKGADPDKLTGAAKLRSDFLKGRVAEAKTDAKTPLKAALKGSAPWAVFGVAAGGKYGPGLL